MRKYGVKIDLQENTLTILNQAIPVYYSRHPDDLKAKPALCVNLAYQDGVIPLRYSTQARKTKKLPTQIMEHKGIPLRAACGFTLRSGHQQVVETGLTLEIPEGLYGEIHQPWGRSRFEPSVAPGVIIPGHQAICVLLANLQGHDITIKRHQIIAFVHLVPTSEIQSFHEFGTLEEMGLPSDTEANIHNLVPLSELSGLDSDQRQKAMALFEKYRCIFAEDDFDLGCAVDVTHHIDTGDNAPICMRPIRRSRASEDTVNDEIQQLIDRGMLVPSRSPWASPVLIVKKKDGSNRVVIDYRRLNNITKKDSYPLPRIDDALDRLGGAKYFSAMDLISGYWQIKLPKEEQEKCAIITSQGLFQPTRMPQGLCNAPATFQRAMDTILGDLKLSCVLVYLDDINVFSRTFSEHLEHLEQVFRRLAAANLKIKPRKCQFFKDQLEYLGFVIDARGLRPQPAKIEAISKMKQPESKRDIQVFLGMVGYYRRFIPNFSRTGEPLFHLLKDGVPFNL